MPPLLYDPSRESLWIFRVKYTVLPRVITEPVLYVLLAVHIFTLRKHRQSLADGEEGLPVLNWKVAAVCHSLLSFFLVFYSSQCYNRFYELHTSCRGLSGCMHE